MNADLRVGVFLEAAAAVSDPRLADSGQARWADGPAGRCLAVWQRDGDRDVLHQWVQKKPTRRLAFFVAGRRITSCRQPERREQLQRAWRQQPGQRERPGQRLQQAWRQQPGQPGPEQQREPEQRQEPALQRPWVLPSCRKRKRPGRREQQRGETVSLLVSLIDK